MSEKICNILWIDDEHEKLGGVKRSARDYSLVLHPFKSKEGGLNELERNFSFYDGVLLDAKFFESEDDVAGSEDTGNSIDAKERIDQLPKKFEIHVLTGQAEAFGDRTYNKVFKKVFRKGVDEDEDKLFESLRSYALAQIDTQIRHKYQRVFDVCVEKYIGESAGADLLKILREDENTSVESHFNTIRKIVEDIFIAFNKFQLLPVEFIRPNVALNPSSIFLSGGTQSERSSDKYKSFSHGDETHLPSQIASNLRSILSITQDGSHRSNVDEHIKSLRTPYLLNSVVFQLLDVIVWFKQYADSKPKTENWTNGDSSSQALDGMIEGRVINHNTFKGFAFFSPSDGGDNIFIPPHIVTDQGLTEGVKVKVESEEYIDNRTGEAKNRVKRAEII